MGLVWLVCGFAVGGRLLLDGRIVLLARHDLILAPVLLRFSLASVKR
jgi:hypothetical protein